MGVLVFPPPLAHLSRRLCVAVGGAERAREGHDGEGERSLGVGGAGAKAANGEKRGREGNAAAAPSRAFVPRSRTHRHTHTHTHKSSPKHRDTHTHSQHLKPSTSKHSLFAERARSTTPLDIFVLLPRALLPPEKNPAPPRLRPAQRGDHAQY